MTSTLMDWSTRRFDYTLDAKLHPELVERLRSLPLRAEALVRAVPPSLLALRDGPDWSIIENFGHLADLDKGLWSRRLDQFDAGDEILVAADMGNAATFAAEHNARGIDAVLAELADERGRLVARLSAAPAEYFAREARHPRLETRMRVIDMLFFQAEHDDHHLARVREMLAAV